MKWKRCLIGLLLTVSVVSAQETYYSIFAYSHFIPSVVVNDQTVTLQSDLYPDWYRQNSVARDMRWVREQDSSLVAFWEGKGDTVLHLLCELSGIEWQEAQFDIYLVRYFPSFGSAEPLILPIGGDRQGTLVEAAPSGNSLQMNLIYQLAKRMLAQSVQLREGVRLGIAFHPLMRPGPYRRDNMAMLLTLATCQNVLGIDSTFDAFESAWWRQHFPGREILQRYLVDQWILTPDQTLADWIASEPYSSHLVAITRTPRPKPPGEQNAPRHFIEGLPIKGQFGFSLHIDQDGYLAIDSIDIYRLGYACGLRTGDRIRTVNSARVLTHKDLVERIFNTFYEGGATLQVLRDDMRMSVIMQPMLLPWYDDSDEFYDENLYDIEPDSTYYDSLPPDSVDY